MLDSNCPTCQLCGEVYDNLYQLGLHIFDKHVPKSKYRRFFCPVCRRKYKYGYRHGLGLHWYKHHSGLFKNTSGHSEVGHDLTNNEADALRAGFEKYYAEHGHYPPGSGLGSLDALKSGFKRFYSEHGHYPTSREVDKCPYLCSARYIQMKYGGLRKLRQSLGLDIVDYGKGSHRQSIGQRAYESSMQTESEVKEYLIQRYGEICVHEERKYGSGKTRVDFFVYAKVNFAVEVFSTNTIKNVGTHLNIKLHKYADFPYRLYFVVMGGDFSQKDIDLLVVNKDLRLLPNMQCLTFEEFKRECLHKLPPLRMAVRYATSQQSEMPFLASHHWESEKDGEPSLDSIIE